MWLSAAGACSQQQGATERVLTYCRSKGKEYLLDKESVFKIGGMQSGKDTAKAKVFTNVGKQTPYGACEESPGSGALRSASGHSEGGSDRSVHGSTSCGSEAAMPCGRTSGSLQSCI